MPTYQIICRQTVMDFFIDQLLRIALAKLARLNVNVGNTDIILEHFFCHK